MSAPKYSRSFLMSVLMGVFLAAPCAVKANTLKIQSVGSKIWKINVPLDTPKVLFHIDNIHSKYALGFAAVSFLKKFESFTDEFQQKTGKEKLGIALFYDTSTDRHNVSRLSFSFQSPSEYHAVFYPFILRNLLDTSKVDLRNDELIKGYKSVLQKQIQDWSVPTLWDRIRMIVYKFSEPKTLIPIMEPQIKQLDKITTADKAPIVESIRKGAFQGVVIGEVEPTLLQEWSDWADKNFSGKPDAWQAPYRNFDGKVHFVANNSLKDKHNVVMLLPMVNIDSPYYAHSLILKEFLLPTLSQGQGGALYSVLRFSSQPLFNGWDRDLSLCFQCLDRETSVHIGTLNTLLAKLLTTGMSQDQFAKAKENALAFVEYFKTDINLLTQFVNMLRSVTQSTEKANEIVMNIENTLNILSYEQFNASLKEFYTPHQATYFFEGDVNTVSGLVD